MAKKKRKKGFGFFGELSALGKHKGKRSTEVSIGVNVNGREREMPTLTPNMSNSEINQILSGKMTKTIVGKAIKHSRKRESEGKGAFAQGRKDKRQAIRRSRAKNWLVMSRSRLVSSCTKGTSLSATGLKPVLRYDRMHVRVA